MPQRLGDLPVGANGMGVKVKDPDTKFFGKPIIWIIADKNHTGYPANSVTLITEKSIAARAFDAKEPNNLNSDRKDTGNNRYSVSNISQWLNSNAVAGEWYSAQHTTDAPPTAANAVSGNAYDTDKGFLNGFSASFKAAMLTTTLTVAKNTVTDGGGSETVSQKMFLASSTEVGVANENGIAEGARLNLFSDDASRINYFTTESIANDNETNKPTSTTPWYWNLRSPVANTSSIVRTIKGDGKAYTVGACGGGNGVRPLCNLPLSTLVSDTVDSDGCYTIIWNSPPAIIYGGAANLGTLAAGRDVSYSVSDAQGDAVTVTERLDGKVIRTYTPELGAAQRMEALAAENYMTILNGIHTLTIEATDGNAEATPVSITFSKSVTACSITLTEPMPYDAMPTAVRLIISGNIPADAILTAEVCNNAFDTAPTWEDISGYVEAGYNYNFANTAKTAAAWGVNFRVRVQRGSSGQGGYIYGIEGGFK